MKHVHIIGICGVATSALAIAFHRQGFRVTGSDKGFYPPISTYLRAAGVDYYAGWHPELMEKYGLPEVVIAGGAGTSLTNPEIIFAKERGIRIMSFAEALGEFVIKKNSVVITGTWGKTTTSALVSFIFLKAGFDPSYFTGGISLSHAAGAITASDWSVVEGDEYQAAIWDKQPKFAYYAPTHLILTSVVWDHADLYPTETSYFAAFEKLVAAIPPHGYIVACIDNPGVCKILEKIPATSSVKIITYGKNSQADYRVLDESFTGQGLRLNIRHRQQTFLLNSPLIGHFNTENICAAFALTHTVGIDPTTSAAAIAEFKGIKRRLELRGTVNGALVFDDIAHSPAKATSLLATLKAITTGKIIAVFEPNSGNRTRETAANYDHAFRNADRVIIPRLTKLKIDSNDKHAPLEGEELASVIGITHPETMYIDDDAKLMSVLQAELQPGDAVAFLGSHGFRGMIEELLKPTSPRP